MILLRPATNADIESIRSIAYKTWPKTYGGIISTEQIQYMLDLFYTVEHLQKNISDGEHFIIAENDKNAVGFCSYILVPEDNLATKIRKLYVLPENHQQGIGKLLLQKIEKAALISGSSQVTLNVNRENPAVDFYKKLGFVIASQEDIPLDHGYFMNDFVMQKPIH